MDKRNVGNTRKRPKCFFEKTRNPASTPKSGNTNSSGSVWVEMVAKSIVFGLVGSGANEELWVRYAGTACIMNGENKMAPKTIGKSQ